MNAMEHRYTALPFACTAFGPFRDGFAVVSNGKIAVEIDLASGASAPVPGAWTRVRRDPSQRLRGLVERVVERTDGPWTRLCDASGRDVAVFPGELIDADCSPQLLVARVSVPGPRVDVVARRLDGSDAEIRLPGDYGTALAVDDDIGVAVTRTAVHVYRSSGDAVESVSLGTPDAASPDVAIHGHIAWLLCHQTLLGIDLDVLPFGRPHASASWQCAALASANAGDDTPATVAFVLPGKVLFDHPRFGRLTVDRTLADPPVVRGQRVRLDDVIEAMPRLFRVRAWSAWEGARSVRPPPPPMRFDAPAIAPIAPPAPGDAPGSSVRLHNAETLRAVALRWGFGVPPGLDKFLAHVDDDPVLRRWLAQLGLDAFEVRHLTADWGADPCVLAIAGYGNGDEVCLYLYPPNLAGGAEPPVVEFSHEDGEVYFLAPSFEVYLARLLAERESDWVEVVAHVRARLSLGSGAPVDAERPAFLPAPDAPIPSIEAARALEAGGDAAAAERAYARILGRDGADARQARAALEKSYAQLGWTAALEVLRAAQ